MRCPPATQFVQTLRSKGMQNTKAGMVDGGLLWKVVKKNTSFMGVQGTIKEVFGQ